MCFLHCKNLLREVRLEIIRNGFFSYSPTLHVSHLILPLQSWTSEWRVAESEKASIPVFLTHLYYGQRKSGWSHAVRENKGIKCCHQTFQWIWTCFVQVTYTISLCEPQVDCCFRCCGSSITRILIEEPSHCLMWAKMWLSQSKKKRLQLNEIFWTLNYSELITFL